MADLEAELLALAGDSSDEETTKQTTEAKSSDAPSSSQGNNAGPSRDTTTPKKSPKGKTTKSTKHDESEEGEISPASDRSASMSESDGGASSPHSDNSGPVFPVDGKFYSEKDKEEIMALPEVRREVILAERASMMEQKQQENILKRLYQGYKVQDGKAKSEKKRKAGTAHLEEGERKSSRQRTTLAGRKVGETSASLEAYKAQREKKGQLDEQRKLDIASGKHGKRRDSGSGASEDAEGDSEVEWADLQTKQDTFSQIEQPAGLTDYNRVQILRPHFGRVCFYPGFENTVKDCYVRVSFATDSHGGSTYRMAKITGVSEGRPYAIEGPNGKNFVTNQYVLTSIGSTKGEYPFIFCSSSRCNEQELAAYKASMTNDNQALPKKKFLVSKIEDINRLINHTFTEAELQIKLKRSGVLDQRKNAIERATLSASRVDAERNSDTAAQSRIDEQLRALEGPKLAFGTSLYKPATQQPEGKTQQQRLAEINAQNRRLNTQSVRRAQLAERKARMELMAAVERGEAVADPLARVKSLPRTHYDVNNPHSNRRRPMVKPVDLKAEEMAAAAKKRSRNATPMPWLTHGNDGKPRKPLGFEWKRYDKRGYFDPGNRGIFDLVKIRRPCWEEVLASYDFDFDVKVC